MKKSGILVAAVCMLNMSPIYALSFGDVLTITPANENANAFIAPSSGSWFSIPIGGQGDLHTSISGHNGIHIGATQMAFDSHFSIPDSTETPNIDNPWGLLDFTGMHQTTIPISIVNDNGSSVFLLDFSGWGWDAAGFDTIPIGDPNNFVSDTGVSVLTCSSVSCVPGDVYELDYFGHVSLDSPYLAGLEYTLHLEGYIATVPLPSTLVLYFSGLLSLLGVNNLNDIQTRTMITKR